MLNRRPVPLPPVTPERLDDAARAGWLYYVGNHTQDEVAHIMGVSRQAAQRLVTMARTAGLVKVRLDHHIGRCLDLAQYIKAKWRIPHCLVAPSDPQAPDLLAGVAAEAAWFLERHLAGPHPVVALGTGRALRATVDAVLRRDIPGARVVSLLGNMREDGEATPYNATIHLAERIGARHWPNPLPVLAADAAEVARLHAQEAVRRTFALARGADITLVGIGGIGAGAPIVEDGFMHPEDAATYERAGAAGEITSWVYDRDGRVMDIPHNHVVTSLPLPGAERQGQSQAQSQGQSLGRLFIAVAAGRAKVPAIRAALEGRLLNGLVTNELTAERLLHGR